MDDTYPPLSNELYPKILEYFCKTLQKREEDEQQKFFRLNESENYAVNKEVSDECERILKNDVSEIKKRLEEKLKKWNFEVEIELFKGVNVSLIRKGIENPFSETVSIFSSLVLNMLDFR